MKNVFFAAFLIAYQACTGLAFAETHGGLSASEELTKLKQEKQAIDSDFKKQEAACYKKFAVSDCLQEAKIRAQKSLNAIKSQELEIKEMQRQSKIESSKQKQIEKDGGTNKSFSETRVGGVANGKSSSANTQYTKTIKTDDEILKDKAQTDTIRIEQAKRRLDASNRKQAESQRKNQTRELKNSQSDANLAKYNQKIALAASKKAAIEKENSERKKPKAATLPIPETLSVPTPTPTLTPIPTAKAQ